MDRAPNANGDVHMIVPAGVDLVTDVYAPRNVIIQHTTASKVFYCEDNETASHMIIDGQTWEHVYIRNCTVGGDIIVKGSVKNVIIDEITRQRLKGKLIIPTHCRIQNIKSFEIHH